MRQYQLLTGYNMYLVPSTEGSKERMTSSYIVNCALTAHSFSSFRRAHTCSTTSISIHVCCYREGRDTIIVEVGITMHTFGQSILKGICRFALVCTGKELGKIINGSNCVKDDKRELEREFQILPIFTPQHHWPIAAWSGRLDGRCRKVQKLPPKYDAGKVWWEGVLHAVPTNTLVEDAFVAAKLGTKHW